ncbi:MAG: hypothetical protein JOZ17_08835 [Acetobacteraceae bacterium]|nr:hypothetical protein [Acetobacteraceae bacterium]
MRLEVVVRPDALHRTRLNAGVMATALYESTGKPVNVWAFVQGAKPNRIFYAYEFPASEPEQEIIVSNR